jgi:hypothetical protein
MVTLLGMLALAALLTTSPEPVRAQAVPAQRDPVVSVEGGSVAGSCSDPWKPGLDLAERANEREEQGVDDAR